MDCSLTLSNNNQICYDKTASKTQSTTSRGLSFHFAFDGKENFIIKKRKLSLFPDSFLTLNSGTSYSTIIDSPHPVQLLSICFDKNFIEDFNSSWLKKDALTIDNAKYINLTCQDLNETIYPLVGDMKYNIGHMYNLINSNSKDELLLNEHLYHSLINYHFLYNKEIFQIAERLNFLKKGTREEIYRRLSLAKEYLYSNYNQNINLKQLAEHSCMSVNYLLRMFKHAFNMTPHQFLMRIRLHRAKLYIENTAYPINEIVNIIGLNCTSSFIELFKQRYHITPLKYRCKSNSTRDYQFK